MLVRHLWRLLRERGDQQGLREITCYGPRLNSWRMNCSGTINVALATGKGAAGWDVVGAEEACWKGMS